ncbi:hypothetical protein [Actinokineospora enzanensis]|uniref:hypothetical protein n=1 Tax=Actinokineospora enzanensis TaxID=155975 RepID=UPI000376B1AB|nr:hypothetical protein [Actinokineospora enzanensis]
MNYDDDTGRRTYSEIHSADRPPDPPSSVRAVDPAVRNLFIDHMHRHPDWSAAEICDHLRVEHQAQALNHSTAHAIFTQHGKLRR